MEVVKKIIGYIDTVNKYVAIAAFAVMSLMIILQVIFRYILGASLSFSEELARFLFIWSTLLGSAMCLKRRSHVSVELLIMYAPRPVKKYMGLVANLIGMIFYIILIIYGFKVVGVTMGQTSAALGIKMGLVYLSIPLSGVFMLLNGIYNTIEDLQSFSKVKIVKEVAKSC